MSQLVQSGDLTQRLHFFAPPGTTITSVQRKRGSNGWVPMVTPSVAEDDSVNAPGAFSLLLDEDMTITAGKIFEPIVFYISGTAGFVATPLPTVTLVSADLPVDVQKINSATVLGAGTSGDLWRGA